jgi:ABC-type nitrate/sulfonate/bicarbonate transport system substrate-binding protein
MKPTPSRWCFAIFLAAFFFSAVVGEAAQKDLQKLTVGYTPISGATLPFFIAVEERLFQKYGFEIAPVFMGGSPLINSAILAG